MTDILNEVLRDIATITDTYAPCKAAREQARIGMMPKRARPREDLKAASEQHVMILRVRADYLSEQPDQTDADMHRASADEIERLQGLFDEAMSMLDDQIKYLETENVKTRAELKRLEA